MEIRMKKYKRVQWLIVSENFTIKQMFKFTEMQ